MNEGNQARRILSELVGYFWHNHIYELNVRLKQGKNDYEIEVSGFTPTAPEDLDEFTSGLQESCQPELADYYDQLLGADGDDNDSYHFLGSVIDQADITYEKQILRVKIVKSH